MPSSSVGKECPLPTGSSSTSRLRLAIVILVVLFMRSVVFAVIKVSSLFCGNMYK